MARAPVSRPPWTALARPLAACRLAVVVSSICLEREGQRGPGVTSGTPPLPLSFIAFSDPNDLLTYYISDRYKQHCDGGRFANITVTNGRLNIGGFAGPALP